MPATECNAIRDGLLSDNPLEFLSKNLILTSTDSEGGFPTSAEVSFDFSDDGATVQGGRFYACVVPGNPRLINGILTVSYLPWGLNAGYYIILEPEGGPDIMMTATMDGCSVGYIRGTGGAVRVSHHNVQSPNMDASQKQTLGFANNALHPSAYRHNDTGFRGEVYFKNQGMGFVFGVRRKGLWTMYSQKVVTQTETEWRKNRLLSNTISIVEAAVF